MADPNTVCARCGWRKSTHAVVAGVVGETVILEGDRVLICPTAIFDDTTGPHAHANAVAEELKKTT